MLFKNLAPFFLPRSRNIFAALVGIFNSVSESRIEAVGPDRACAEWLMRNGAYVRWLGHRKFVEHYDGLPLDEKDLTPYYIEEIDATNASISHHGFPHLKGCKYITKVKFHNCWHVNDAAISQLDLIANSLCQLEITNCAEITEKGMKSLQRLRKLQDLRLGALQGVKNLPRSVTEIKKALPDCSVNIL